MHGKAHHAVGRQGVDGRLEIFLDELLLQLVGGGGVQVLTVQSVHANGGLVGDRGPEVVLAVLVLLPGHNGDALVVRNGPAPAQELVRVLQLIQISENSKVGVLHGILHVQSTVQNFIALCRHDAIGIVVQRLKGLLVSAGGRLHIFL